jgi:hypothetical protein
MASTVRPSLTEGSRRDGKNAEVSPLPRQQARSHTGSIGEARAPPRHPLTRSAVQLLARGELGTGWTISIRTIPELSSLAEQPAHLPAGESEQGSDLVLVLLSL